MSRLPALRTRADVNATHGFYKSVREFKRRLVLDALRGARGSVKLAAEALGIGRSTLQMMLATLGVDQRRLPHPLARVTHGEPLCAICTQPEHARDGAGSRLRPVHYAAQARDGRRHARLCKLCSTGLSMFRDDPRLLGRALAFLDGDVLDVQTEARVHVPQLEQGGSE